MRSVRARLAALNMVILAAVLVAMALFVRGRVQANLYREIDADLSAETSLVKTIRTGQVERPPSGGPGKRILLGPQHDLKPAEAKLVELVRSNSSAVQLESRVPLPRLAPVLGGAIDAGATPLSDPRGASHAARGVKVLEDFQRAGEPMRSLSIPIREGAKVVAVVQAVRPMGPVLGQMTDLDRALLMSVPAALLLAAVAGTVLVLGTMRPIRKLTESALLIEGDLGAKRLPIEGGDEFSELAKAFNGALDRTSEALKAQARAIAQLERFTGDAGHELRTPLAAIKANASFLLHMTSLPPDRRSAVEIIDRSSDRMARLIDDLLLLARQDSGASTPRFSYFAIQDVILDSLELVAARPELHVSFDRNPPIDVVADKSAIERIVTNLVSNAVNYASTAVSISVVLLGSGLEIRVTDDGPGVAPEHLSRLGERFFRPDEARSREGGGVGLGLAIVRSLCEWHGGTLVIESGVGVGTTALARIVTGDLVRPWKATG